MKKVLLIAALLLLPCAAHADDSLSVHPNTNAAPADLPRDPNSRSNDPVPNYYPYQDYEYNHGNHPPGGQPGAPPIQGPQGNQHGGVEHGHHHDLNNSTSGSHHGHDMGDSTTGHDHDHDHDMDHSSTGHDHDHDMDDTTT